MRNNKNKKDKTMLWELFKTFFKIGFITFGGGYAMIPLIEAEVVDRRQWLAKDEFLNLIAVSQSCPGVFAVNISTFIGYKMRKVAGAVVAAVAAAAPAFVTILALALVWQTFQDVPIVQAAFRGIRPAVVALIAVPTFTLAKSAKLNIYTFWIPIVSALLIWLFGVNPVIILLVAGFLGYLFSTKLFT